MSLHRHLLLGIPITTSTKENILEEIEKGLKKSVREQGLGVSANESVITIYTPNPEIVMYAKRDEEFKRIVTTAQINIPDGGGICWAIRRLYRISVTRISGVDLMENLCKKSEELAFRVGILGGRGRVALDARERLISRYPRLEVDVMEAPEIHIGSKQSAESSKQQYSLALAAEEKRWQSMMEYINSIADRIREQNIRILFVALGFPKQELLIAGIRDQLMVAGFKKPIVLMAVGGSLDYISGRIPRAPVWMQNHGIEWVYRLLREPTRLLRQIRGGEFFLDILFRSPR